MTDECTHIWGEYWQVEAEGNGEWEIHDHQDWGIGGIEYCPFCGIKLTKEVADATIKKIDEEREKRRIESEKYWAEMKNKYERYKKGQYKPSLFEKLHFDIQMSLENK
jgi:hypothetical protein